MTDPEKRENVHEEHIPPAHPATLIVQEETQDELTAGEETIAEHIATGVPTDATVVGARHLPSGAYGKESEEDYGEALEESDVTEAIATGTEAGDQETSSS